MTVEFRREKHCRIIDIMTETKSESGDSSGDTSDTWGTLQCHRLSDRNERGCTEGGHMDTTTLPQSSREKNKENKEYRRSSVTSVTAHVTPDGSTIKAVTQQVSPKCHPSVTAEDEGGMEMENLTKVNNHANIYPPWWNTVKVDGDPSLEDLEWLVRKPILQA